MPWFFKIINGFMVNSSFILYILFELMFYLNYSFGYGDLMVDYIFVFFVIKVLGEYF